MIKLIRETPKDEIFSRQQWWLAGESYEVLVSYEQPLCYLHITDKTQRYFMDNRFKARTN